MALQSGNGGSVKIASTVIPVGRWSGNWRVRDSDITQSDSGNGTLFFPVIPDNSWEASLARDDTAYPEAVGMTPGAIIASMFFKLGAGTKGDKLVNTMVEEVATVCDNAGDVVRVTIRGKGGILTPNATIT